MPARTLALTLAGGLVVAAAAVAAGAREAVSPDVLPAFGTYDWPVRGPVIHGFDPPETPYGAGHRGIDIAAQPGTTVRAPADGVVAFAGKVPGALYVSVDHPDGIRTTYSWLDEVAVRAGQDVRRGDPLGATGSGHPGVEPPHLHLGARLGDRYVDPLLLLARPSVVGLIHLAPLERARESSPGTEGAGPYDGPAGGAEP